MTFCFIAGSSDRARPTKQEPNQPAAKRWYGLRASFELADTAAAWRGWLKSATALVENGRPIAKFRVAHCPRVDAPAARGYTSAPWDFSVS
jgi:hypothetical protein